MPIITTQRRMAEQGRIRLGHKITGTNSKGREYTRPAKLERFRFTSPSERLITEIATTYGGEARPWGNDGKAEFEVLSEATAIPVIVVKGGFSQWHEFWTRGGCQHRCDGEKDVAGNYCDPQDPNHIAAIEKPTTRLSVMLSEIESLGVWRMESKGWNAAAELPSMAELAMHVGDLVPATLGLAERSSIIQTDKGPQTSRYVVPFLDLHVTKQRLVEIVGGKDGAPALEGAGAGTAAIEAPAPPSNQQVEQPVAAAPQVSIPTPEQIAGADLATLRQMVAYLAQHDHGEHPAAQAATARIGELEAADVAGSASQPDPTQVAPQPDADGVYEGETVGPDADQVWADILKLAGQRGMKGPDLEDDVATFFGGMTSAEASGAELAEYLKDLESRPVEAGAA
ncbi:hypothetical protein [Nocardioides sp. SYSU D00065]|uniref:recombination directionality factor n=1 Tax=Nocardioides sp. SYSU D00065 TaxID=2817378 RepID=UPI001B328281|nr:hypothetical protein [Nocardioides sp. SYSU D00065]